MKAPRAVRQRLELYRSAEGCTHIQFPHHRISLSFSFCAELRLDGNLTLISTIISPLSVGFLLIGIPRSGKLIL